MSSVLSALSYSTLLAGLTSSAASTGSSQSGSMGDQLLAAMAQAESANTASTDPLLQEMVSLSPAALGLTTGSDGTQTYNAQGLLQQAEASMMFTDPLLQSSSNSTPVATGDSLLQDLLSSSQQDAAAASSQNDSAAGGSAAAASTAATGSTDPNANWAQLLMQDPSLAPVLVQSLIDQGIISNLE
jgi:hypothetical protein